MTGFYHTSLRCNGEFFIEVGGITAGQSKDCRYNLLLPAEQLLVSVLPVGSCKNGVYLPVYFILNLGEGVSISREDEHIKLYAPEKNALHIDITFPVSGFKHRIAHTMCATDFSMSGRSMRAAVYYNSGAMLCVEDAGGNIRYAESLGEEVGDCKLSVHAKNGGVFVCARVFNNDMGKLYVLCVAKEINLALQIDCDSYTMGEELTTQIRVASGAQVRLTYPIIASGFARPEAQCIYSEGFAAGKGMLCFARVLRYAEEKSVMDLLHPSLRRDVSYGELMEYMGGFAEIYDELCDDRHLALAYKNGSVYNVRRFAISFSHGKIDDISE